MLSSPVPRVVNGQAFLRHLWVRISLRVGFVLRFPYFHIQLVSHVHDSPSIPHTAYRIPRLDLPRPNVILPAPTSNPSINTPTPPRSHHPLSTNGRNLPPITRYLTSLHNKIYQRLVTKNFAARFPILRHRRPRQPETLTATHSTTSTERSLY